VAGSPAAAAEDIQGLEEEERGVSASLTFDTGALVALERRKQRMTDVFVRARQERLPVIVPAVAVAEWWRGRTDVRTRILGGVLVESLDDALARLAGDALAAVRNATMADAVIMASAARRGSIVYTSDVDDLERLRAFFPTVRVLGV
jgi:predicted nucleic acid-binding protein